MMMRSICVVLLLLLLTAESLSDAVSPTNDCEKSYMFADGTASPSKIFTIAQINQMLKAHNDARIGAVPTPDATMNILQWSQTLANFAQEHVDGCPGMRHSTAAARTDTTRLGSLAPLGENLAAGTSNVRKNTEKTNTRTQRH